MQHCLILVINIIMMLDLSLGASLRKQFVLAMEEQAMQSASAQLLALAQLELQDACPTDNCDLCQKIDTHFEYTTNNYPCDTDGGTSCCGTQCRDLGISLSYLEAYVKYLKPTIELLLTERESLMNEVKQASANIDATKTVDEASMTCLQQRVKLRTKALTALRIKISELRLEKAGALYNLQRVFRQCVDGTWCENDDTQAEILPDTTLWGWLDEKKCDILSYLIEAVGELINIAVGIAVPFIGALEKMPLCQVELSIKGVIDGISGQFTMKQVAEDVKDAISEPSKLKEVAAGMMEWLIGQVMSALCKLKDDVPEIIGDMIGVMCWITDTASQMSDALGDKTGRAISLLDELISLIQNLACGQLGSVLVTLVKMPIMCSIDSCANEFSDDCDSSLVLAIARGDIFASASDSSPTAAPTQANAFGKNVIKRLGSDIDFPIGYTLKSISGQYTFEIMPSGSAVLHDSNGADVWDSFTTISDPNWVFQSDGNLVLYGKNRVVKYASDTSGDVGEYFAVSNYGSVMILTADLSVKWSTFGLASPSASIINNDARYPEFSVWSQNGIFQLTFQNDGNLVLYGRQRKVMFKSDTDDLANYQKYFQFNPTTGRFAVICTDCTWSSYKYTSPSIACDYGDGPFIMTVTNGGEVQVLPTRNSQKICYNSRVD